MQLKSSVILALSSLSYTLASTSQDILNELSTLTSAWTTLQTDVQNLPPTVTLDDSNKIAVDLATVEANLLNITATVQDLPGPLTLSEGLTVFFANNELTTLEIHTLNATIAKKPSFDTLPVPGFDAILAAGVVDLDAMNTDFQNALLAVLPAEIQDSEVTENSLLHNAFEKVIAAYGGGSN